MKRYLLVFAVLATGCAGKNVKVAEPTGPDTSGVIAIMSRHSIAHACAVGPHEALTAAHVIDPRPFDDSVPLKGGRWSQGNLSGLVAAEAVVAEVDLGFLSTVTPFSKFYERSASIPEPGEKLYLVEYNWKDADKGFAEKVLEVTVTRVVAGHVIFEPSGKGGSSGSCLLNKDGKLVGINIAGKDMESWEEVGIAVGLWGSWWTDRRQPVVIEEVR